MRSAAISLVLVAAAALGGCAAKPDLGPTPAAWGRSGAVTRSLVLAGSGGDAVPTWLAGRNNAQMGAEQFTELRLAESASIQRLWITGRGLPRESSSFRTRTFEAGPR